MIRPLHARSLNIPFRQRFTHAAATRRCTQSVWVELETADGSRGLGEGCPRDYVTGETVDSALAFIREIEPAVQTLQSLPLLRSWVAGNSAQLDRHPAAWCAVELALLDALARAAGQSVEALLGLPAVSGEFTYTAVLGAESPAVFSAQLKRYLDLGFRDFKLKLSGNPADDQQRFALLRPALDRIASLRLDANNLWRDAPAAVAALGEVSLPCFAVEEPLAPGQFDALRSIARSTGVRIILDESFLRVDQLDRLQDDPAVWILNLRVSKLGGLLRTLEIAERATDRGIPFIIGCQVGETSLLTRAALTVAAGHRGRGLLAQEGAFGQLLLESDPVEPSIAFGAGGRFDASPFDFNQRPGFGLTLASASKPSP